MHKKADQGLTLDDPVAAYDAMAAHYRALSTTRGAFLQSVERIVASRAKGSKALLDIGAADARRTLIIAQSAEIPLVVALEPSAAMRAQCPKEVLVWACKATDIPVTGLRFDVITCLWNVLGHLHNAEERAAALARARGLLTPTGMIFADFANRYNAVEYGWSKTLWRFFYDRLFWSETNGDVIVGWETRGTSIRTHGHVFTHSELQALFKTAGLIIKNRWILNYRDGTTCKSPFSGHLLYRLAQQA